MLTYSTGRAGAQVRQVATMDDPARAKAEREREEEARIRERETLERKQARRAPRRAQSAFHVRGAHSRVLLLTESLARYATSASFRAATACADLSMSGAATGVEEMLSCCSHVGLISWDVSAAQLRFRSAAYTSSWFLYVMIRDA